LDSRFDASRLESLLESAKLLSASLDLDDMLRHLLRTVMGRLLVSRGVITIARGHRQEVRIARGVPGCPVGSEFTGDAGLNSGLDLMVPIGEGLGMLALAQPLKPLDAGESDFLQALLGLAASSIANAKLHEETLASNRTLDQKIQELRALLDLVRGLAATTDAEEVAKLLTLTLAGRWAVSKHAVVTWRENAPAIRRVKGLELPEDLRQQAEAAEEPVVRWEGPGGAVMFPIRSGEACHGAVVLGPRPAGKRYSEGDLEFGAGLVAQAGVALDNAWHFRETLEKKQIEKELQVAASIQVDLFPKELPRLAHTEIAARNRQARQVGGDYYDVLPFGTGAGHLICVADISGKGISAALLMSNIQATLRALLAHDTSLKQVAREANDLLWASTPSNKYATVFFLQYDQSTGHCQYVNGGHTDGLVLRGTGEVELLSTTGLPVGLFPRRDFDVAELALKPGDTLLLYSDGASEANDVEQNEFGLERLTACLRDCQPEPGPQILDRIIAAIDHFAGEAPQFDDITLLVLKRTA
jgi:phosphoserine phosphatase RsbU/P